MYSIDGLCPSGGMGGCGFHIHLSPEFRDAVAKSGLGQKEVDRVLDAYGVEWSSKCGLLQRLDSGRMYIDRHAESGAIPSKDARAIHGISVRWGEWGPEHISVPGNACGLDIGTFWSLYDGGRVLLPHNVDHWGQVNLLLIAFCWFAHSVALHAGVSERVNLQVQEKERVEDQEI